MRFLIVTSVLLWEYFLNTNSERMIYAPYDMQTELRNTTYINISWQHEDGVTLSVKQLFIGDSTELLLINGTDCELFDAWDGQATVMVENSTTEMLTAMVALENTQPQNEGQFSIEVKDSMQNTLAEGHFELQTYALPVGLVLKIENTNYTEGDLARFVCSGNVGRPLVPLVLQRSGAHSSYFGEIVAETDMAEQNWYQALPNGTFSTSYTFELNVTRNDGVKYFRCAVKRSVPVYRWTYSDAVRIFVNFTGTQVTLGPTQEVILNSQTTFNQTVSCTLTSGEKNSETGGLILMQIIHRKLIGQSNEPSYGDRKAWATVTTGKTPEISNIRAGLQAVASGQLNKEGFDDELTLTWNSANVQCVDAGAFDCVVTYLKKPDFDQDTWNTTSSVLETLKVQDININLEMKRSGFNVGEGTATLGNPLELQEGQIVELTCTAEIGMDRNTLIDWSNIRPSNNVGDELLKFTPSGLVQQPATDNGCGYTKIESFSYNITRQDVNNGKKKGFACNISYTEYRNPQEKMISSRAFYIQPYSPDSGNGGGSQASVQSAGSNAGAIAGGVVGGIVLIVLIVLLVYFLWYRRRGDGETCSANVGAILGGIIGGLLFITAIVVIVWLFWFRRNGGESYRTKEDHGSENPNMVTNSTDYAVPHKERRGYENNALDEPHEERSRRRNDHGNRGRANHAMDRDYDDYYSDGNDSPTMTPHLNHMGGDPHGSIGTGV